LLVCNRSHSQHCPAPRHATGDWREVSSRPS
jgi:hypothetical protein